MVVKSLLDEILEVKFVVVGSEDDRTIAKVGNNGLLGSGN